MRLFLIWGVILWLPMNVFGDSCKEWFKKEKLKPGKDCLMKCVSTPVEMGTFHCTSTCEELCKSSLSTQAIHNLLLYPGLTKKERALIAEKPMDLANNRAGILAAEELEKNHKRTSKALEERALEEMRHNRLIVLDKKGMPK